MLRTMMKTKIHRATVTQADLHYVGSVTVDEDLLDAADLLPGELVHIVDVTNGARLETYTIAGRARLRRDRHQRRRRAAGAPRRPGDPDRLRRRWRPPRPRELQPHVVFVDADNKVLGTGYDPAETLRRHRAGPRRRRSPEPIASCMADAPCRRVLRRASRPRRPAGRRAPTSSSSAPASPG